MEKARGISIAEFKGYSIHYHRGSQRFLAYDKDGNQVASAETEEKLIAKLTDYIKRKWTPVEVISVNHECVVKITSRDINEPESMVWISFKDDEGEMRKEKCSVSPGWGGKLYEKTPENMKILEVIQQKSKASAKLEEEIEELKEKFTKEYQLPPIS